MNESMLLIGGAGGIGSALLEQWGAAYPNSTIYAVSRNRSPQSLPPSVRWFTIDNYREASIQGFFSTLDDNCRFSHVFCCTGVLHQRHDESDLYPEKRIESVVEAQMMGYFQANTLVPALWLKHLIDRMADTTSYIVLLSARVGSISDNRLGGWYGYRTSKAALNMFVKTAAVEYARRAKQTVLVCYHPGTVDTPLSEPFQSNVPSKKLFTPAFTAQQLLALLPQLGPEDSPAFRDWEHKTVNW